MSNTNYKQLLTKAASLCREASAQLRAGSEGSFNSLSDRGVVDTRTSKFASESGYDKVDDFLLGNLGGND